MKKQLLTLSLILTAATTLCAQEQSDVTKFFLSNAGFDTPIDYPASSTQAVRYVVKNPAGWTADIATDSTTVATVAFGFGGTFCGAGIPAAGYDGQGGGALALSTGQSQTLRYYQAVTLPAGEYTITTATYNAGTKATATSQLAWVPESGTTRKSRTIRYTVGEWTVETVSFSLSAETAGVIQIGMKSASGLTDNSAKLLIDYVKIESDCNPLASLKAKLEAARLLDTSVIPGRYADRLNEAIALADAIDADCTAEAYKTAIDALTSAAETAAFAIEVAKAEPDSTGAIPTVTLTNHYVAIGANEALMRANMTGSNIQERGVCWSTDRMPTVMDNRATKTFTLNGTIYHIQGMEPATVYYLRPYAMAKNHYVAYGDEVKIVTHPKGTCTWSWDNGAPTEAANERCRTAMEQTIEYFNQWTGIQGFHLSGHYGAQTPTADCSYGGWMRIGPNPGNQAIGTVLHETGHGVGVGTSDRWWDTNVHNWEWLGREATEAYRFLENQQGNPEYVFVGDRQHGWGANSTFDWLVNGADKDKHQELQYIGGMCILHGFFIDGLCPTTAAHNGISGYTYNFDDSKKYYLMSKNPEGGLSQGLLCQRNATALGWKPYVWQAAVSDSAAWYLEFDPQQSYYMLRNAATGKYMTHAAGSSSVSLKSITGNKKPGSTEFFQFMPDRTDVQLTAVPPVLADPITTHGYWFTWYDSGNKALQAGKYGNITRYGTVSTAAFNYTDQATNQQWIIISEDELPAYQSLLGVTPQPAVLGDLDGDGIVSVADISLLISVYLTDENWWTQEEGTQRTASQAANPYDLSGDGIVSVADISQLLSIYLENDTIE